MIQTDCWSTLQIPPTTDRALIKRAYAVLLKQHRPDRDPKGFKQLKDAYDEALWLSQFTWEEDESEVISTGETNNAIQEAVNCADEPTPPTEALDNAKANTDIPLLNRAENESNPPSLTDAHSPLTTPQATENINHLLDEWLLPNEWLNQLNTLLDHDEENPTPNRDALWQQWLQEGQAFRDSEDIRLKATEQIMQRIEWQYAHGMHEYYDINTTPEATIRRYLYDNGPLTHAQMKILAQGLGWWDSGFAQRWQENLHPHLLHVLISDLSIYNGRAKIQRVQNILRSTYLSPATQQYYGSFNATDRYMVMVARLVDLIVFLPILAGLSAIFRLTAPELNNLAPLAVCYFLLCLICECSPYKSTIGGRCLGIRLITQNLPTPNLLQIILHYAIYGMTTLIFISGMNFVTIAMLFFWSFGVLQIISSRISKCLFICVPHP